MPFRDAVRLLENMAMSYLSILYCILEGDFTVYDSAVGTVCGGSFCY